MQDAGKKVYNTDTISGQRDCTSGNIIVKKYKLLTHINIAFNHIDCNCGVRKRATRIVGGQETGVNEFPWMVRVVLWNETIGKWEKCGGSIISNQHILTAAHCTAGGTTSNLMVHLGEHDTTDPVADIRTISAITDHPDYGAEKNDYAYDISILTLSSPITFSRTMAPVCLPSYDWKLFEGELATVTGWGTTSYEGFSLGKLMKVDVTVTSYSVCNNAYEGIKFPWGTVFGKIME